MGLALIITIIWAILFALFYKTSNNKTFIKKFICYLPTGIVFGLFVSIIASMLIYPTYCKTTDAITETYELTEIDDDIWVKQVTYTGKKHHIKVQSHGHTWHVDLQNAEIYMGADKAEMTVHYKVTANNFTKFMLFTPCVCTYEVYTPQTTLTGSNINIKMKGQVEDND